MCKFLVQIDNPVFDRGYIGALLPKVALPENSTMDSAAESVPLFHADSPTSMSHSGANQAWSAGGSSIFPPPAYQLAAQNGLLVPPFIPSFNAPYWIDNAARPPQEQTSVKSPAAGCAVPSELNVGTANGVGTPLEINVGTETGVQPSSTDVGVQTSPIGGNLRYHYVGNGLFAAIY